MTMLSELLKSEQFDTTEPASFYVPGSKDWEEAFNQHNSGSSKADKGDEE